MTLSTLIGYKAFSDLATKLAYFFTTVLAARVLTREDFGVLALATTTGWILAVICDFGVQLHMARELARTPALCQAIIKPLLRVRVGSTAAALLVAAVIAPAFLSPDRAVVFLSIVLAQLIVALVEFLNYVFRGLSRSDLESSLNLGHRLAVFLAAVILLPLAPRLDVMAAVLLVPAIAALVVSLWLVKNMAEAAGRGTPEPLDQPSGVGSVLVAVWPIGLGVVLSALYFRLDLLFVGYWNGAAGAGLYNAVFRLVEALRLFPAAVLAVTFPELCRARDLRPLLRVTAGLGVLSLVCFGPTYALAPWIVARFYGAGYLEAVPAFRILLLAVPLLFVNYALTHQLIGWDSQRFYAGICGIALCVNVSLNAVLIPKFGISGAAWTTLLTECVLTAGCLLGLRVKVASRVSMAAVQAVS